jgi:hypothetical protein
MTPWTISIEVTVGAEGEDDAQEIGLQMVDYLVSGWDGAAGAVMKVEPNA